MADYDRLRWKELFSARILSRGLDYCLDGKVRKMTAEGDTVNAVAAGSDDYAVRIRLDGDEIAEMVCDCPYAADGNNCKHEAAVLYKLTGYTDESDETESDYEAEEMYQPYAGSVNRPDDIAYRSSVMRKLEAERDELRTLIDRIPEDELKNLLFAMACGDGALRSRLEAMYGETVDEKQLLRLKTMISDIEYEHSDRSGFIDWRHASDFAIDLVGFLNNNVQPFVDRGMLMEAFDLTCEVFLTVGNAEIDDDGDIAFVAGECIEFWRNIAGLATDEQQAEMYEWFSRHTGDGSVYDYMEDYLEDFRMTGFHSGSILHKRLNELDEIIAAEEAEYLDSPDTWYKSYRLERHIVNRIETMIELDMPRSGILEYMERYTYLPDILLRYAEELFAAGDTTDAAALLQDGKTRNADDIAAVRNYSRKLIDIYSEQDMKEELVEELKFQVLNCYQRELEYIDRLKASVSAEEWQELREIILEADSCDGVRLDLLCSEKLHGRLLEEIKAKYSVHTLERYEEYLRQYYSDEIRDMYAEYAKASIGRTANRKQYYSIVQYLRKLKRFDGGREMAEKIAAAWKIEYRRRPALLDELRKAGF